MNFNEIRDNLAKLEDIAFIRIKESKVNNPFFSIAIPTFKRAEDLRNTINTALNQDTNISYEVIVVDNNPDRNDDTEILLNEYNSERLSYCKNEQNVGMVANWNRCLMLARGEWVVYCHDDDLLEPTALTSILKMIQKNPNSKAITSRLKQVNNPYTKASVASNTIINTANAKALKRRKWRRLIGKIVSVFIMPGLPVAGNLFHDNIYGPPTCGLSVKRKTMIEFGGWWDEYIISDWITMIAFTKKYKAIKNKERTGTYIWKQNASMKQEVIKKMSIERKEIIKSLPNISALCGLYTKIFNFDFERKMNEEIIVFDGKRSLIFRLFQKYYGLRIQ